MPLAFYFDQHVKRAIVDGLRSRGVDVLTAYEDEASALDDADLLTRATFLNRVLFSQDRDLLIEAAYRQKENIVFIGIIYGHQLQVSIGGCIEDLELIAKLGTIEEVKNNVIFLPL
jgi:predicted nuclease of predicted toxin-antitoxin system